ncbi:MAG: hypothetical protein WCO18_00480 [bacterium]
MTFNPKLTSTSSKYYAAVKTGSGSINYDRSGQVCTIVDAKGKISTINNCAEGNDQSDSLSFDNTTNCTIDYTSGGKSVEKTYPNCSIIDSTGGGGSCSYFYGGKIITVNNCQSIKDNSTDYTINTNYCSVFYTYTTGTGKNIKTKSTSKSYANCSNIAYDALTGICTYDLKGKPNQTQNNCTGIINYAVNTMDIEFLYTPSPGNDGKIVLNAGDTESFTSYLYYTKCTNSPGSATASFTMLDPDGQVVPGSYFKGKVSSGTTDSDKHVSETVKGEFDESFTAPSKPGRYTILYTVTDTSKYKSSGAKTGYFNFWVKDSGHTCTVNSVCRSVANSCGNTNQGVVTSCDQSGSEVCSIDTKIAPPEPASGICAACVPTYSCSNGKVVNNCDSVTKDCAAYGLVCSNSGGCTNAGGVTIDPLTQNNDGTPKAAVSIKSTIVSPNTVNPYDVIKDPAGGNCNLSWELNQYDASSTCSIYKGNSLTSSSPFTPSSSKGTYSDQKITNETNYKLSCGETDATNSLIPTSVVSKYATCYINSSYTETNR